MPTNRRDFLKTTTATLAAGWAAAETLLPGASARAAGETTSATLPPPQAGEKKGEMIYRELGRTGESVSLIGLGGHHIGRQKDEKESIKIIRTAIDRGITFMDNCWDYHDGLSEIRMGKALRDGYRDKVFQMTKIDGRTKKEAAKQIDESLARLQTDRLDLVQHHEVLRFEDPDQVFDPFTGAMLAAQDAQKAGKVRYIGFTGHKDPLVHLRMLDVAAENGFRFDTVQMPLNVLDAHFRSFEKTVLPRLVQENIGVLGMKTLGDNYVLQSGAVQAIEAMQYVMNLPISVLVSGIDSLQVLDQAFEAVRTFKPMDPAQTTALLARTAEAAVKGRFELYKTTPLFDSTAENHKWLGYPEKPVG